MKPKLEKPKRPNGPGAAHRKFSFADADGDSLQEKTWFRRAVDAGLRYKEELSERSGMKVVPEFSLLDPEELKDDDSEDPAEAPAAVSLAPEAVWLANAETAAPRGAAFAPPPAPPPPAEPPAVRKNAFAPDPQLIGGTAINAFVQQDGEAKKRTAAHHRQTGVVRTGTVTFYQPIAPRRYIKKALVGLVVLGGLTFCTVQLRHSRLAALISSLRAGRNGKKAGPTVDATDSDNLGQP